MESSREQIEHLVSQLGPDCSIVSLEEAGGGRGVFSEIWRVAVDAPDGVLGPPTVIAKLPAGGPNGEAARASGAYQREALAYEQLLADGEPPRHPSCHVTRHHRDGGVSFLMEDLGRHRAVGQSDGLALPDALRVVEALAQLHRRFEDRPQLEHLEVRRSAPAAFPAKALHTGLQALVGRVTQRQHRAFATLLERRRELLAAFDGNQGATLCHGDPRADNLVFDEQDGGAILFDWQQLAVQIGEADLAWFTATSIDGRHRHDFEPELLHRYAEATRRSTEEVERRYRLGFILPGLAVLLLAQRETPDDRTAAMVATSIGRIATALVELDVTDQPLAG